MPDIDPGVTQNGADPTNHTRSIQVTAEQDIPLRYKVGGILINPNYVLLAPGDGGGEPEHWWSIHLHPHLHQVCILFSRGGAVFYDLQPPIASQNRSVNEVDMRLRHRLQESLDKRGRQRSGVIGRDLSTNAELNSL